MVSIQTVHGCAVHFVQLRYSLTRTLSVLTQTGIVFAHFDTRTARDPKGAKRPRLYISKACTVLCGISNKTIGKSASLWSLYRPFIVCMRTRDRLTRSFTVLIQYGLVFVQFDKRTARPRLHMNDGISNKTIGKSASLWSLYRPFMDARQSHNNVLIPYTVWSHFCTL